MATGMLHLHNLLRWVILILLLVSIIKAYAGWQSKKAFNAGDRKVWLFTMIATHINFLVALYLLFLGRFGILTSDQDMGNVMKNRVLRFFWIEHPAFMLIALILITLGAGMAKKPLPDTTKYKRAFWLFFVALLMILVAIPWPGRELIGRPLFPGMQP